MEVVLLGHSFIRRLRDDLVPWRPQGGRGTDVGLGHPLRAAQLARAMGVSRNVRRIYTFSDGIVRIGDVDQAAAFVRRASPGVLLLDVGSNDLAHIVTVDPVQVLRLAVQLTDVASLFEAAFVIINAIIPRTGNITCVPDTFRENAELFNTFVKNICETSEKLVFHKLRGFWNTRHGAVTLPCQVPEWSTDGIHCDTSLSMRRYRVRTKHAILAQVARATKQIDDATR